VNITNFADLISLVWFLACWLGYTHYSRRMSVRKPSLTNSLDLYREDWIRACVKRENRVADASVIGNLERNGAFFASSCMLILAGILTALGYTEEIIEVFSALPFATEQDKWVWELRMVVMIVLFVYAFFKFTWSMRLYNFVAVMISSAPHPDDIKVTPAAREALSVHAGRICNQAGDAFNLGLRTYYYALAVISWFMSPYLFMVTSTFIVWVLYRREFKSEALKALRSGKVFEDVANYTADR